LWGADGPERLPSAALRWLTSSEHEVIFSAVSIWEVAIKAGRGQADFTVDAGFLRAGLVRRGLREVALTAEHAVAVLTLPRLHKDPFDRVLIAQAQVEGAVLLTADRAVAAYGAPVEWVG